MPSVCEFFRENAAVVSGVSPVPQILKVRVFLRRTAAPVLQSLKETFEVLRWRNRVLTCNVPYPHTQWHMVETLVEEEPHRSPPYSFANRGFRTVAFLHEVTRVGRDRALRLGFSCLLTYALSRTPRLESFG